MHSYLRSVGFSNIRNRIELDQIFGLVMDSPTSKKTTVTSETIRQTEIRRDFGDRFGLTIRGEYDEKGFFHLEHYFPHIIGRFQTAKEDVVVNKRVDTDAYTAMCDDIRLGVSLIFYLQNSIDYLDSRRLLNQYHTMIPVTLAALSTEGKILLPVEKDENQLRIQATETKQRYKWINEAKQGSQEAIDSLTLEDIDIYAMISRRAHKEDIYSIVESSFIPYGSESDNYTILGTIQEVEEHKNLLTGEELYELTVNCNDLIYSICINKTDLLGEPLLGRRFKGNVWLQGTVHFTD